MQNKLYYEAKWFTIFMFFLAGAFFGGLALFTFVFNGGRVYGIQKIHLPIDSNYKFINPLLAVDVPQQTQFFNISPLQSNLSKVLTPSASNGLFNGALYYQDLESGRWVGINENNSFSPGRLIKVPLMIAYFKEALSDQALLDKKIIYVGTATPTNSSAGQLIPVAGHYYSINDLIKESVINDDANTSTNVLFNNIDHSLLNEVFTDLGISYPVDPKADDYITIKQYTLFFRILYNSTYLTRDLSNTALDYLSQASRTVGFSAALPNDLDIAHRYSVRTLPNKQLESLDCGIVYYPNHPYQLCIMLIAKDQNTIDQTYIKLSQVVFQDVDNKYADYQAPQ